MNLYELCEKAVSQTLYSYRTEDEKYLTVQQPLAPARVALRHVYPKRKNWTHCQVDLLKMIVADFSGDFAWRIFQGVSEKFYTLVVWDLVNSDQFMMADF